MLSIKQKVGDTSKKLRCKTVAIVKFSQKIWTITLGKKQQICTNKKDII